METTFPCCGQLARKKGLHNYHERQNAAKSGGKGQKIASKGLDPELCNTLGKPTIRSQNVRNFRTQLESNRRAYVDELIAFCRQRSVSTTGEGIEAMAKMVVERLGRLGAKPRLITVDDSYPYVFAEIGEGPRTLLIYNHYDVQPAQYEDGWTHAPFDPVIRQGRLYARGVADNKANLLFRIQAVEVYQAVYGQLPVRVRFLIEGEEEIGSPNLPHFVEKHTDLVRADGCIWESGRKDHNDRPVVHLGLRGILYVELMLQAESREIHSSWANVVENPAMYLQKRLRRALESLTDPEDPLLFDNLMADVQPLSQEDRELLEAIPFDLDAIQVEHNVTLPRDLTSMEVLRRLLFEPSCNICGVGIGYTGPGVKTVIPNRAVAKLDLRLPPGLTPDQVEKRLRCYLDERGFDDIQLKRLVALHPARSSPNTAIARAVQEAVEISYGIKPVTYPLMPASGPMHTLCQALGTPALTFGAGHAGDNVHGVDENLFLEDYFQAIRCFAEILRRFAD